MGRLANLTPDTNDSLWNLTYKIAARIGAAPEAPQGSAAQVASRTVVGTVRVYDIVGYNNKASDQYILVFDAAALPPNGTVPRFVITAPAGFPFSLSWANGRVFSNGCVVCTSSTPATLTIGSADCFIDINC